MLLILKKCINYMKCLKFFFQLLCYLTYTASSDKSLLYIDITNNSNQNETKKMIITDQFISLYIYII